ncbi:MAG: ABC transporter ATP-binding protein [Chloroflexi bacterium]|nr:ABC transporter ATP-binding protein [Chloroflexota bacterium]MCZ6788354.1 ABC transporter ATP-binding protein [Chloroflexota bacterium]MCZ6892091.1 ABC transporter ATP-binding protein [Chloroflexota bacterium]
MLLEVKNLRVQFDTLMGLSSPVDGISFSLEKGETLGIVGESGCGKSMSASAILRLVPPPGRIVDGEVLLDGTDLLKASAANMRQVRGHYMSMVLQDPVASLNPVFPIGNQVAEAVTVSQRLRRRSLKEKVIELLQRVRIPSAENRIYEYPHQMSGGMRQRVAGAISFASNDLKVLIADEPTTALDVTVQAQYLDLLKELQADVGFGLIFISHDIGAVAELCDKVSVMYAGKIVETGPTRTIINHPRHPYTKALLDCLPRLNEVKRLEPIGGEPPNPFAFPPGCRFAPRCPRATELCHTQYPDFVQIDENHDAACWYANES